MKGNRPATPARTGPFTRLSRIWRLLFLSLALDGIIAFLFPTSLSSNHAQAAAIISAALTIPFFNQARVARGLATMRKWQSGAEGARPRFAKAPITVAIGSVIAAKVFLLPTLTNIASLLVAAILLLGIVSSIRHVMREARTRSQSLMETPWLYVRLWERQIVVLFCIPMVAARVVSLCGSLSVGSSPTPTLHVTYLFISVVLLLTLRPQRSSFVGWCSNCKAPTPIAFVDYGTCPQCDEQLARNILQ